MKNIKLIYRLIVCLSIFYVNSIEAQENTTTQLAVTFNSQSKITDYGLFFGNNFQFGPRITPHGDCIDVVNGFAFVGWYRGDMDDRSLMLSRKDLNDPNSEWVTVEFPHSHYGFRHNRDLGDSHNTISVGISTFDNRVHLIYDLHAYTESNIPNDFFNYSVSAIGGAFVPDEEFNLSLFENENTINAKLNYLKQGENYDRLTYPKMDRTPDGKLIVSYRFGGARNGNRMLAHYDENGWSDNWNISNGRSSSPTYSMYGYSKFQHGTFYTGFSIRTTQTQNYELNQGLYFMSANSVPTGPNTTWSDTFGNPINVPFANDVENIKIAMPEDEYGNAERPRSPFGPNYAVTENGAIHFTTRVDNINVHYYKNANESSFSSSSNVTIPANSELFAYLDHVFSVNIIGGKLTILRTKEGTNNWQVAYQEGSSNLSFKYQVSFLEGNKFYVYLMEQGSSESLPLHLKEFTLSEEIVDVVEIPDISIEAENFSFKDGYALVQANENASNQLYIGELRDNTSVTYNFDLNNFDTPSGTYNLNIIASNQDADNATMDVAVNGQTYADVPIARTNDWNVFEANTIEGIELIEGQNSVVIEQNISEATRPDVLQFFISESLSSNKFSKDKLSIYPNPSSDIFHIETNLRSSNYRLISIQGKVLEEGVLNSKTLNFSKYARGLYLLQLASDAGEIVEKIVIK